MTRTKKLLLATPFVLIAAYTLADWRDWFRSPDLLSHAHTQFDQFTVFGDAPFCLLLDSHSEFVDCHYLSEEHCMYANRLLATASNPEDRALCVPNPLR